MKTKSIVLEESLVDAIQARQIKLSGLERLMAFAMSTSQYTIPDDKINALKEEYFDVNAEYEMLKQNYKPYHPTLCISRDSTFSKINFAYRQHHGC